jgi:hypothetical protein
VPFSWSSMGGVSGFVAASLIAVYLYGRPMRLGA